MIELFGEKKTAKQSDLQTVDVDVVDYSHPVNMGLFWDKLITEQKALSSTPRCPETCSLHCIMPHSDHQTWPVGVAQDVVLCNRTACFPAGLHFATVAF